MHQATIYRHEHARKRELHEELKTVEKEIAKTCATLDLVALTMTQARELEETLRKLRVRRAWVREQMGLKW